MSVRRPGTDIPFGAPAATWLATVGAHAAAFAHTAAPADVAGLGPAVIRQGIHAFATLLQYVFPMIFLVAAVVSFVKRSRSITLFDDVRGGSEADIANLSWQAFEALVGEGFRHRGFQVTARDGAGPDGGVDLVLSHGHERFLVQCKQWRAQQPGVSVVRELYGVMAAERVAGGYVVTSGRFTKDAKEFAVGRNIELVDDKALAALLRDGGGVAPALVRPIDSSIPTEKEAPTCPKCKTLMVMRTAKKGSNAGSSSGGAHSIRSVDRRWRWGNDRHPTVSKP
jgi:restriction system protein